MNIWKQLKERKKLIKAFKESGLYLGNEQNYIFPKIHSISTEQITFTLPTGLDPSLIKKNFYVFKQIYGEHVEIKGMTKTFTLYLSALPKEIPYNYELYNIKKYKLPIVAGMGHNKKFIIYDMVEYPHLLIAGETGSGKSTQLRSVLTTLIKAVSPGQLELYLCDLKRSEFHLFRRIKHVKGPFITVTDILPPLEHIRLEMQKRGNLLDQHEVAHIDDLPIKLPYLILCIDEVALLQKEKRIMEIVEEISSIGRALGVFLILSMQRPDSKVLDGKLKVNLTVRMGFKTADKINSRIIGTPGSEKIKDVGKFLLKIPLSDEPIEVLAPFLPLEQAKHILTSYKSDTGKTSNLSRIDFKKSVIDLQEFTKDVFGVLDE